MSEDFEHVESVHESGFEKVVVHPLWDESTMKNDIALAKLETCIPSFNKFRAPVCLPTSTTQFGNMLAKYFIK